MDSPEKDGDDSWSGWSDNWGNTSPSDKNAPEQDGDAWGSWSNENSPSPASKTEGDGWNNDDWGTSLTSSSSKKSTSSASSNQKKSSKPKHKKNATAAKKTGGEPATANLIDFGDSENGQKAESTNDGWDNEVWAQDEDDEWQSLELDTSKAKAS